MTALLLGVGFLGLGAITIRDSFRLGVGDVEGPLGFLLGVFMLLLGSCFCASGILR